MIANADIDRFNFGLQKITKDYSHACLQMKPNIKTASQIQTQKPK